MHNENSFSSQEIMTSFPTTNPSPSTGDEHSIASSDTESTSSENTAIHSSASNDSTVSNSTPTADYTADNVHPEPDTLPDTLLVSSAGLAEKLHQLPKSSGVYLHKDATGKIIYVGKAKNLRNRVRSYFQTNRPVDAKTKALVKKIADLEVIVTDSEVEALILENTLIKEHQPKYNILLKDDKSFPYIRITNEPYPRIFYTRKIIRDGSKYFGPYTDSKAMYAIITSLRSLFPIRSCSLDLRPDAVATPGKFKVCLDYHIKKCEGPCENLVSQIHYAGMIRLAMEVLKGKTKSVERELEQRMHTLAEEFRFEEAKELRDRLVLLKEYSDKQKVVSTDLIDRDIIAFARNETDACAVIFKVRDGKMIGRQHFYMGNSEGKSSAEIVQATCERFYMESDDIPDEIHVPVELDDVHLLQIWLDTKRRKNAKKIDISVPKIGDKQKLVKMAESNAQFLLKELELQRMKRDQTLSRPVIALERDLRLKAPPRRIECFDNSHFQGSETVSSMVVFIDGKPKKSEYRKYKNKTVDGVDDFKSMQEVLTRRYTRMLEEQTEEPNLIVIDGGKGQLSSAVEILKELGLYPRIPVIGLAKRLEEIVFPHQAETLLLPRTSSSLHLLQAIRDEAHRFAIEFHRSLRDKRTLQTELTNIPGIGEKTAQKLLTDLGSVEAVRTASHEQLVLCVGKKNTEKLLAYFSHEHTSSAEEKEEA